MENTKVKISAPISFDKTTPNLMEIHTLDNTFDPKFRKEWPVVYIISNENEAYIGETVDAGTRMSQHLQNPERCKLKNVRFVSDESFNKSVILDLESFLISHMSADGKYKLQNGNAGQQKHDYFQKALYEEKFQEVWKELKRQQVARKDLREIENSNLFKYSPYKSLTADQFIIASNIIRTLSDDILNDKESNFLVNGGAGTGKTILGVYLLKLLSTKVDEDCDFEDENVIESLQKIHMKKPDLKIGLVVSMANLRAILTDTFKNISGLSPKMILKPSTIANSSEKFDILIVDEAHRLKTSRNVGAEIGSIYKNNRKLGLDEKNGTQLDWILAKSKHAIFFYDENQSIKRADVDSWRFNQLREQEDCHEFKLETQLRCQNGGQEYIDYVSKIFSNEPPKEKINFKKYDFRIFDDVKIMTNCIVEKDKEIGLCRNLAGYSWDWHTKDKIKLTQCSSFDDFEKVKQINANETQRYIDCGVYDIDIEGNKYIWNTKYDGWISTANSVNEIGCIHTIQGFDLNYAGVIIGNELKYNPETKKIYIDKDSYFDKNGKQATSEEDLFRYILNIYKVLCSRGICGTYIYACDENKVADFEFFDCIKRSIFEFGGFFWIVGIFRHGSSPNAAAGGCGNFVVFDVAIVIGDFEGNFVGGDVVIIRAG